VIDPPLPLQLRLDSFFSLWLQCIRMGISRPSLCSWNTPRTSSASPGIQPKRSAYPYHLPKFYIILTERQILASASYDDTIKLYIDDPSDDWFAFATLTGHASTVWSLAWSPAFPSRSDDTTGRSHSYFASSSQDNTVRIWQRTALHKWESVLVLGGHERSVYSVSWGRGIHQPAGEKRDKGYLGWLASASGDGSVLVWELWVRVFFS
jgi:WD40 repeat protein